MPTDEKKGITVKIDAGLHAEVRQFLDSHGMTMAEFVAQALRDELHPKFSTKEEKNMENTRTIAFQVPEELFQKIKDYLQRNNMTQKQFMLGLIESEIGRDLAQRASVSEAPEETAISGDSAEDSEEAGEAGEEYEEQDNGDFEDSSDGEYKESEDLDEERNESEDYKMSMGM